MYIPPEEWQVSPTKEEIDDSPWKYIGYNGLTSFMANNSDFFALRRFDRLHTRVLLTLQARLSNLEQKLDKLDEQCATKTTKLGEAGLVDTKDFGKQALPLGLEDVNNGTVLDDIPERVELISEIQSALSAYDGALAEYSSVQAMYRAPKRNIKNVQSWFKHNLGAIGSEEASFIDYEGELLSMSGPKPMLRQLFEDHVVYHARHSFQLFKHFAPQSQLSERDQDASYIVEDGLLEATGSIAMFIGGATMLIVPLWVLQTVGNLKAKLAVITGFVLMCLLFLSIAMIGRPLERMAVTAGYAAVLVVFLERGGGT